MNGRLSPFHTLLVDLAPPIDDIFNGIQRPTQVEIRSFLANQTFEHRLLSQISPRELLTFIRLFDTFAAHKNIRRAERARLLAYNKAGILGISYIKQEDRFVCINFYRATRERATNLHSFHTGHHADNRWTRSQLGRAHRALHWLDMKAFKAAGARYYDLCGWYHGHEDEALLNINKFKEQFATLRHIDYSGVIYTNKLLLALKRLR